LKHHKLVEELETTQRGAGILTIVFRSSESI